MPERPAARPGALEECRAVLRRRARTFALASAFLPPRARAEAAVVYAWCRGADDAVDGEGDPAAGLQRMRDALDEVYAGRPCADPVARAFQEVVEERRIPREYPHELLEGMAADLGRVRYDTMAGLLEYAFRAAGTVGLMMCHVLRLTDPRALRHAAHLGMAMQLTNICRDVAEDWDRGRLYVPREALSAVGGAWIVECDGPLPAQARRPLALATRRLLAEADRYYRSGDLGLGALPWRCAVAVRAARGLYAAIGDEVLRAGCDVRAGRAVVGPARKARLLSRALAAAAADAARRAGTRAAPAGLDVVVAYRDVALA
jgi:phytoene synthase